MSIKCLLNGLDVNYPCSPSCALFGDCVTTFESQKKANVRTNAARIRAMSDEELADVVANGVGCVRKAPHCMDDDCTPCIRKWLQQPAE